MSNLTPDLPCHSIINSPAITLADNVHQNIEHVFLGIFLVNGGLPPETMSNSMAQPTPSPS